MSRFYVPAEHIDLKKNKIYVIGQEARHILTVMRMRESDKVLVFDGTGAEYSGFIESVDSRSAALSIEIENIRKAEVETMPAISLAQSIPKKNLMDLIVEKATELGVSRIIPMVTERTIVRPDGASGKKKIERWTRLAIQASMQCGRSDIPEISQLTRFEDLIGVSSGYDLLLFACLSDNTISIKSALKEFHGSKILVMIGPEGDFTPSEVELAAEKGNCRFVSLGKRVLKTETASLFVLSLMNYAFS